MLTHSFLSDIQRITLTPRERIPAASMTGCRNGSMKQERDHQVAGNLTRDEARQRAQLIDVESYAVELDLTGGETTFGSVAVIKFTCSKPGASTFADLAAPAVTKVTLNGAPVDPAAVSDGRIELTGLAAVNELRVAAECAYSRHGEGLHRFADPADGSVYLYSDLETYDAHQVYACFDQPDLKAAFELTVTAPAGWQVISNMPPDAVGRLSGQASAVGRLSGQASAVGRLSGQGNAAPGEADG